MTDEVSGLRQGAGTGGEASPRAIVKLYILKR
jgi:hypothetical protein